MFEKMKSIKFIKKLLKFLYVIICYYMIYCEMWYTKRLEQKGIKL